MSPKFKARWIADLRKYPKTTGYLKTKTGYCCLGVACLTLGAEFEERLVYGNVNNERPILNGRSLADGEGLTYSALELIGLTLSNQNKLIDLNDRSSTFDPVIKYIEENL
jgi:hypothetical protein